MNTLKNLFFMLKLISKYNKKYLILSIIFAVYSSTDTIFSILSIKFVLDFINRGENLFYVLLFLLILTMVMITIEIIGTWYNHKFVPEQVQKLKNSIRIELLSKASNIDYEYFENAEFYDKYIRAIEEADNRALDVMDSINKFVKSLSTLVALLAIIVTLDGPIIIISIISLIFTLFVNVKGNTFNYKENTEKLPVKRENEYINRLFYLQQYAKDNRIYNIKSLMLDRQMKVSEKLLLLIKKYNFGRASYAFLNNIVQILTVIMILAYLAYQITKGTISIGDFAALLSAAQYLVGSLASFFDIIPTMQRHSLYINDFRKFLSYESMIEDSKNKLDISDPINIKLNNVNFIYDNSNFEIKNINLEIKNNQKIAIVGSNGSGKTTLIKLLLRLYDVNDGEILYCDNNIQSYDITKLRDKIGTVFQDIQSYDLSIAEYLLLREYKDEDYNLIRDTLINCDMYDFVNSLPKGIHTHISNEFVEDGIQLSGGQLQKLAVARVLIKNPKLLILDEASSALDPVSEYNLNKKMLEVSKDKTLILISHRLSITKFVDCIVMMENGEIIEQGTHDELLQLNGKYAEMFNMQAESYV